MDPQSEAQNLFADTSHECAHYAVTLGESRPVATRELTTKRDCFRARKTYPVLPWIVEVCV
jgi:hypothetical protein